MARFKLRLVVIYDSDEALLDSYGPPADKVAAEVSSVIADEIRALDYKGIVAVEQGRIDLVG